MFLNNWVIYSYKHAVNVADTILYYRLLKMKKVNNKISFGTKWNQQASDETSTTLPRFFDKI